MFHTEAKKLSTGGVSCGLGGCDATFIQSLTDGGKVYRKKRKEATVALFTYNPGIARVNFKICNALEERRDAEPVACVHAGTTELLHMP